MEVYIDDEKNLKGLFYQDEEMRLIFDAFPEILLIDGTYKLNNLRLPLYIMLAIDGNGESEIIGLMLLADEQADTLRRMIRLFKKHNSAWEGINCVMADKDMTERNIIKEEIPQAGLLICLFHTMRSFKREITTEKMGISVDERLQVLEIIQSMAHATSEEVYQDLYEQLMETRFTAVKEYFIKNWHSIRNEWVEGNKKKFSNFLNSTNNRLESINQKLKSVITKHSCLLDFHRDLQHCIASLRQERDHRSALIFQKRPVDLNEFGSSERLFFEQCTPYAFSHVRKQLSLVPKVGKFSEQPCGAYSVTTSEGCLSVTPTSCLCSFATSMKLPCRHLLALRDSLGLQLFDPVLCHKRWTKSYFYHSHRIFRQNVEENNEYNAHPDDFISITIEESRTAGENVLSRHDKYRKAFSIAQKIANVASEASGKQFDERLACLKSLLDAWQECEEVKIEKENSLSMIKSKSSEETERETESGSRISDHEEVGCISNQCMPQAKTEGNNSNDS